MQMNILRQSFRLATICLIIDARMRQCKAEANGGAADLPPEN